MQTTKVANNIQFAYQDSGAPPNTDVYPTVILFHGHTYHSGLFGRMSASAAAKGYRLILPNRRLYPGSTPYTAEEAKSLDSSNSTGDLLKALAKQGEYLLLLVDKLIQEHDLQNVTIGGWSLGTSFMNVMVGAIDTVDAKTKTRLSEHVQNLVWWDPPAVCHGIVDPIGGVCLLYDESIPLDQRPEVFVNWVTQYFPHTELERMDYHTLVDKVEQPTVKPATFTNVPFEEILTMVDFSAGPAADSLIADAHFQPAHRILLEKAIFSPAIRAAWGNPTIVVIYGEETSYDIVWAAWQLQEESKKTGLPIVLKAMPGANHFGMYDEPELSATTFQSFI